MTEPVVQVSNLTKRYRDTNALNQVSFSLEADCLYGLLGRNGAGKTTAMSILTGQNFETSGDVRVFGKHPYERADVLSQMCFIRESQRYPDDFTPLHAFRSASMFFRNWDEDFCERLVTEFELPFKRRLKKLSRGQFSAVGVIIGLASRAEITFFDEPYLGLDAVARQLFYDRLIGDYAEHPRTIVLSSHLIDEVANLLEHVIVLDHGEVLMDDEAENIRGSAATVVGPAHSVQRFVGSQDVIHTESIGSFAQTTIAEQITPQRRREAEDLGIELVPVSLQQLIVRRTLSRQAAEFSEETGQKLGVSA